MSNNTPEEQNKKWLELALQQKRFLEEEGRRNTIVSALSSRVPVLIFSQPKRNELLMLKNRKKKKKFLSQRFQTMLLDQFLEQQQRKTKAIEEEKERSEILKKKAISQKPKFLAKLGVNQFRP